DETRLIVADADLDVLWQALLDPGQPLAHAVDDLHGIGARLLADLHADRGRAAQARGAADFLHRVLHAAAGAERDHPPIGAIGDHDAVEVFDVADAAHRANGHVGRPGRELTARNLHVLPLDGVPHLVDGEPVGVQPVRVQEQLNLALALAVVADRA